MQFKRISFSRPSGVGEILSEQVSIKGLTVSLFQLLYKNLKAVVSAVMCIPRLGYLFVFFQVQKFTILDPGQCPKTKEIKG